MAKPQNTLIGKTSGSVGGTTFSSWKGINVLKAKAEQVANPNTPGQQEQRTKLRKAVSVFRSAHDSIDVGMMQQAVKMSGYNAFVSANLKNGAFLGSTAMPIDDLSKLVISKGTLASTPFTVQSFEVAEPTIEIDWSTAVTGNQTSADLAYFVVIGEDGVVIAESNGTVPRSAGTISTTRLAVPEVGTDYGFYLFFYQPSTRQVSDTYNQVSEPA